MPNEQTVQAALTEFLISMDVDIDMEEDGDVWQVLEGVADVQTFGEAGLLTNNCGLVVEMEDGSEYQIQILQSKGPQR